MQISIGCTDGKEYNSDYFSDVEVQKHLDEVDGIIGDGPFTDMKINTPKEFVDLMTDAALGKKINDIEFTEFSLVIDGVERKFNPKHIVWVEAVYDTKDE